MNSIILGIESTAHTAGVGIITSEGKILSNQRSMYIPDQGGIQFLNPNNIIQSCNFPENTKTCPQSMEFIPCDGELILFPSWLMHNTCPNVTDEERISVAFNIDLEIE